MKPGGIWFAVLGEGKVGKGWFAQTCLTPFYYLRDFGPWCVFGLGIKKGGLVFLDYVWIGFMNNKRDPFGL